MREVDWPAIDDVQTTMELRRSLLGPGDRSAFNALSRVYVPGEGGGDIRAMIIGEAPGAQEEVKRRPFVGPAGRVLRDLMAVAGLYASPRQNPREHPEWPNCWLTNVVHYRPPSNRKPHRHEIAASRPFMRDEWLAVGQPDLIICVGGVALEAVTGKRLSILAEAGKVHWFTSRRGRRMAIWPMVHPAFGLRNPAMQPLLEKDWITLARFMSKADEIITEENVDYQGG